MSEIQANKISPATGTGLTLGDSGDTLTLTAGANLTLGGSSTTVTIPSGATITNSGTANGFGEANKPAFHAYKSGGSQSVPNNTVTKISFETELFDSDGCYDKDTNYRFTPTTAGYYYIYYQLKNANQTDYIYSRIRKNGSTDLALEIHYTGADVDDMSKGFTIVHLNGSSDYVEVYLQQTKGSSANVPSGEQNTYFGGYLVTT